MLALLAQATSWPDVATIAIVCLFNIVLLGIVAWVVTRPDDD